MKKLYSRQAVVSFIGIVVSGLIYQVTDSDIALVLGILFLGSLAQCIYDLYKEDMHR